MKKIALASIVIFSSIVGVFANLEDKEILLLRKQINISDRELIRRNKDEKFPAGHSLKVFLAVKHNKGSKNDFEEWVAKWNTKDSGKYGKLEIVNTIEDADIVIAQFVTESSKYVGEESVTVGTVPRPGEIKPKLRVESERGYKPLHLPVRSYLLVRSDNMLTIVYSDVETSIIGEQQYNPDLRLWSSLEKKMRER
ncbi:MAG TPA: hypothetical protein VK892_23775 [Pyrinomonadaceae bacterium]|nr:hypothetical protein [Pyrinomonadaceae bacterium]